MTEPRTWDYRVTGLVRAVDGDTADLTVEKRIDFGFRLTEDKRWSTRFRLLGIDTWETNQAGGAKATADATEWITRAIHDDVLRGQTFKTDNFGRWLIDLYRTDTAEHLADYLRAQGDEKVKL
jgi:endonuclease YncB( thermonuclease family)